LEARKISNNELYTHSLIELGVLKGQPPTANASARITELVDWGEFLSADTENCEEEMKMNMRAQAWLEKGVLQRQKYRPSKVSNGVFVVFCYKLFGFEVVLS